MARLLTMGRRSELDPQLAEAYNNRGTLRGRKGDLDGAVADFDETIRLNPRNANAYTNRGNVRYSKGEFDGAISDYIEAIRMNPQFADAYKSRGNALYAKSDLKSAIPDYQKYLDLGGGKQNGDQAKVEEWIRELQKRLQ